MEGLSGNAGPLAWVGAFADRLGDILECLHAHIIEDDIHLSADLPVRVVGNADSTRLRNAFKSRCDIDPVPENVILIDDDVTDVDADAELDPQLPRYVDVVIDHCPLDCYCAARGVDGADEFDQHAVAGGLDNPAAMRGDRSINQRLTKRFQFGQRALFIATHQSTVAGDVCRQHRCQSPLHVLAGQDRPPERRKFSQAYTITPPRCQKMWPYVQGRGQLPGSSIRVCFDG